MNEFLIGLKEKYLPKNSFRNDFVTLSMGRVLSQVIPLAITPLLTRLYTPEDFGIFATFLSLVTIVALISNGRYNLAITLPKKLNKATELLVVCMIGVVATTLFSLLLFLSFRTNILNWLSLSGKGSLAFLIPIGVFIVASIESVYYWLLRRRDYKFLSRNFVIQTGVSTLLKLGFAFLYWGWFGLVFAYILGALLSLIFLAGRFLKNSDFINLIKGLKKKDLLDTAKEYKEFPLLSMPADGINSFANQLPNILLNSLFGSSTAGFYSVTQRVLGLPVSFVSSAMADVYRDRASADYREKGDCRKIFLATLKYLTLFSIPIFAVLFLFAPTIVPFLLGDQWVEVGRYIRILTPLFLFRFIASPLSSTLYINKKQKHLLLWQIGLLICTVGSFYIGKMFGSDHLSLTIFSASYSVMYVILIILGYKFTKK
jgi:O-antigen/teichoic acid export membrane protein